MAERSKDESKRFESSFRKLEALAEELQENKISVDELVPKMREALGAIQVCKEVLKETKLELKKINDEFDGLQKGFTENGK